jgi:hypothetical protein
MTPRAVKFVRFKKIEDHFRRGWTMMFPNAPMHHHRYGVEMAWLCECPVPGLKSYVFHRVPESQTKGREDERSEHRA